MFLLVNGYFLFALFLIFLLFFLTAQETISSDPTDPVDFYEEVIEGDPVDNAPSDLVQINANLQEVKYY